MKTKNWIILAVVIGGLVIMFYSLQDTASDENYVATLERKRKEKTETLRSGSDSPFIQDTSVVFSEPDYFPIDPAYRLNARLTPVENKQVVVLGTSDGKEKRYVEYAWAEFALHGKENKLLILESIDMGPYRGTLFLAFADETSGDETYGAGRYLDLKKVPGATSITLDFNEAYNPYCAYSNLFSCPLPPRDNLLSIPIRAGEKTFVPSGETHVH